MKLTDLELCKRIAEIEGEWVTVSRDGMVYVMKDWAESPNHPLPTLYFPLTNKALLLDLIYDYDVSVCRYRDSVFIESDYTDRPHKADVSFSDKNEFARAALECIVEVNK
jgi:hypothetical protein